MHILSKKALRNFWTQYPDAESALEGWYRTVKRLTWRNFAEVRAAYRTADLVGEFTVFNIGGNKYRLIAHIHFNRQKVFVRHILTHKEYARGNWKAG